MKAEKTVVLLILITFLMGVFTSIFIYPLSSYKSWCNKTNKRYYPQIVWENEWRKD